MNKSNKFNSSSSSLNSKEIEKSAESEKARETGVFALHDTQRKNEASERKSIAERIYGINKENSTPIKSTDLDNKPESHLGVSKKTAEHQDIELDHRTKDNIDQSRRQEAMSFKRTETKLNDWANGFRYNVGKETGAPVSDEVMRSQFGAFSEIMDMPADGPIQLKPEGQDALYDYVHHKQKNKDALDNYARLDEIDSCMRNNKSDVSEAKKELVAAGIIDKKMTESDLLKEAEYAKESLKRSRPNVNEFVENYNQYKEQSNNNSELSFADFLDQKNEKELTLSERIAAKTKERDEAKARLDQVDRELEGLKAQKRKGLNSRLAKDFRKLEQQKSVATNTKENDLSDKSKNKETIVVKDSEKHRAEQKAMIEKILQDPSTVVVESSYISSDRAKQKEIVKEDLGRINDLKDLSDDEKERMAILDINNVLGKGLEVGPAVELTDKINRDYGKKIVDSGALKDEYGNDLNEDERQREIDSAVATKVMRNNINDRKAKDALEEGRNKGKLREKIKKHWRKFVGTLAIGLAVVGSMFGMSALSNDSSTVEAKNPTAASSVQEKDSTQEKDIPSCYNLVKSHNVHYNKDTVPKVSYEKAGYYEGHNADGTPDFSHKNSDTSFSHAYDMSSPENTFNDLCENIKHNPESLSASVGSILNKDQLDQFNYNGDKNEFAQRLHQDDELRANVLNAFLGNLEDAKFSIIDGADLQKNGVSAINYGLIPKYDSNGKVIGTEIVGHKADLTGKKVLSIETKDGHRLLNLMNCKNDIELSQGDEGYTVRVVPQQERTNRETPPTPPETPATPPETPPQTPPTPPETPPTPPETPPTPPPTVQSKNPDDNKWVQVAPEMQDQAQATTERQVVGQDGVPQADEQGQISGYQGEDVAPVDWGNQ